MISSDLEQVTLSEIGVSTRWVNKFVEAGVTSVADLKGKSEDDLLELPGIGQKAVEEVRDGLGVPRPRQRARLELTGTRAAGRPVGYRPAGRPRLRRT